MLPLLKRTALFIGLTVFLMAATSVGVGTSLASAQSPPPKRCVGWAIPGAVGGMALGYGVVVAGYAIAGQTIENSAGDIALVLGGESLGMILGPVGTCAAFGHEPHVFPAASFAIAGGLLGGTLVGVPLALWWLSYENSAPPDRDRSGENLFVPLIYITAVSAGIFAGGWAGLVLERQLRGPLDTQVMLVPTADGAGLFFVGRF